MSASPMTATRTAVIAVDEKGNVVNGDMILYICGKLHEGAAASWPETIRL